jgi:hypothetical protein
MKHICSAAVLTGDLRIFLFSFAFCHTASNATRRNVEDEEARRQA